VLEKSERGKRIVEGVVPGAVRGLSGKIGELEGLAKVAEGMGGKIGPSGAGEL